MSAGTWLLALIAVALSATAQLMMKIGMSALRAGGAMDGGTMGIMAGIMTNIWVFGGLAAYAASAALWLGVLSRAPLSLAYPLSALGIAAVVIASWLILREPIGSVRLAGVLLILTGVSVMGLAR